MCNQRKDSKNKKKVFVLMKPKNIKSLRLRPDIQQLATVPALGHSRSGLRRCFEYDDPGLMVFYDFALDLCNLICYSDFKKTYLFLFFSYGFCYRKWSLKERENLKFLFSICPCEFVKTFDAFCLGVFQRQKKFIFPLFTRISSAGFSFFQTSHDK